MRLMMLAGVLVALTTTPSLGSLVIYNNGSPDLSHVTESDVDGLSTPIAADNFALPSGSGALTDVHWWGAYILSNTAPATDNFTLVIYDDAGGKPGAPVYGDVIGNNLTRTLTNMKVGTFDLYSYDAQINPAGGLTPGVTYWLSINNNSTGTSATWAWASSAALGNAVQSVFNGPWVGQNVELAFNLTGVPEPSTLVLASIGLLALSGYGIRRGGTLRC